MPVLSNLEKLHTNLIKDGYDLPDLKTFEQDLGDVNKLGKLHTNLIKDGYDLPDIKTFQQDLGVKKKAESSSSSGGLAGPYASGQKPSKPKGFGNIVSEKIAEVTPAEQKQAKENDAVKASVADFGRKLEKVAKNNPQMAVAGGMEQLAQKKKVEELDTYGGTVKRIAAENFSKLLKAPAGGLQIVKSTFGDDKTVNGVEKFLQEIADVGSKVSDEIKKEDELISNNKETSITKLLGDGKFAEAGSRLGKGVVGSLAALPMYMNPATIGAMVTSAAADAGHQAKLEGRSVKDSDVAAEVAIAGLEVITEELFGTGSVVSKAFSKLNKSGADAALDSFRKSFQKDLAKTYGWELGGELSNTLGAYVINKARGKEQPPLLQQLSDTALQTAAMTSGFHTLGNVAGQEKETFSPQEPLTPQQQVEQAGVLDPNTGRLVPKDPNDPELPPNTGGSGDLMSPEAMQQAGVEPGVPALDLQNLDPATQESVDWYKQQLGEDLNYYTEKANKEKPKNVLQKGVNAIDKLFGGKDFYKVYTNDAENIKRQLDLLESDPIAFFEEKLNKANEITSTAKDEKSLSDAQEDVKYYSRIIEGLKNSQQSQEQAPNLQDLGINADENNIVILKSGDSIEILGIEGDVAIVRNGEQSIEIPLQDILNEQVGQETSATEGVIQEIINSGAEVTDNEGNLVNLEEKLAANVDPNTLILTEENRTVEDVITEAEGIDQQEQQVPQEQSAQQAQPIGPKKIYHYTTQEFEGQPTPQPENTAASIGDEPLGTFYHTDPNVSKQAVGGEKQGDKGRLIEADYNPKNPLVTSIDSQEYVAVKQQAQEEAIKSIENQLSPEQINEIQNSENPIETVNEMGLSSIVNPIVSQKITDILVGQGYDAVEFSNNGDIVILDPSAVVDSYTVDEADMNNVDDSQAEVEYDNYYDNLELSDRGKELQQKIDSIDDILKNKDKPLSNTAKFRLKDMSTLLLKGDIYGLVNLALLNIKTPILLKDGVLNNGTKVKGIGVNKKDTWITTSTDANKAMSYDKLIDLVTEYVTDQVGQVSQTDEQGNASVAELIANADIPNMVYDIITGSKEDVYNTLRAFTDQEVDTNALMAERTKLEEELDSEQVQYEEIVKKESNKIDLNEIQKNFELLFEVDGASKKKNLTVDPKVMEIYNNFDSIIEQLGYKKTKDSDC